MKRNKLKNLFAIMAITLVTSVAVLPSSKASAEWLQADNGNWSYSEGDNSAYGWKSIDDNWYFFDTNGFMKTGWLNDNGSWYYLASSGAMKTGWLNDNGSWYYLNSAGTMQTGLTAIDGKTYYLSESGAMKTGNIAINGVNYTFAASGEEITSATPGQATTSNTTTTASTTESATTSSSSSSSGGSSSADSTGGSSSNSASSSSASDYKSLYGTWSLGDCVSSTMTSNGKLTTSYVDALTTKYGNKVTISSTGISTPVIPISDIQTKEGTMTASEFKSNYNNVSLSDIGISGDSIKYIKVTGSGEKATIFISNSNDVYVLFSNLLYELEK